MPNRHNNLFSGTVRTVRWHPDGLSPRKKEQAKRNRLAKALKVARRKEAWWETPLSLLLAALIFAGLFIGLWVF